MNPHLDRRQWLRLTALGIGAVLARPVFGSRRPKKNLPRPLEPVVAGRSLYGYVERPLS
ncbi:MAG: hypothetical protein U1E27_07440 [Kiritimatiellia bacterium]|nr:hypothetical protein [Kiritimatiellia bacterium]